MISILRAGARKASFQSVLTSSAWLFLYSGDVQAQTTTVIAPWPTHLTGIVQISSSAPSGNFTAQGSSDYINNYPVNIWFVKSDQPSFFTPDGNWITGSVDESGNTELACANISNSELASGTPFKSPDNKMVKPSTAEICADEIGGYTESDNNPLGSENPEHHQMIQATFLAPQPVTGNSLYPNGNILFPAMGSSITYSMDFQPTMWLFPNPSGSDPQGTPDQNDDAYSQMSILFDYCPIMNNVRTLSSIKLSFQPENFSAYATRLGTTTYGQDVGKDGGGTGNYTIEPKFPDMDPRDVNRIMFVNNGTTTLTTPQSGLTTQSYTVTYQQFAQAITYENKYAPQNPQLDTNPSNWCWESAHVNTEVHYNPGGFNVEYGWRLRNINISDTVPG